MLAGGASEEARRRAGGRVMGQLWLPKVGCCCKQDVLCQNAPLHPAGPGGRGKETLGAGQPEVAAGVDPVSCESYPHPKRFSFCLTRTCPFKPLFFAQVVRSLSLLVALALLQKALTTCLDSVHLHSGFAAHSLAHLLSTVCHGDPRSCGCGLILESAEHPAEVTPLHK